MRATRRTVVTKRSYESDTDKLSVQVTQGGKPVPGLDAVSVISVDTKVMEWTDASHIHSWFVKNVQDGKDDRQSHLVTDSKLYELLDVCERVLEASHLVPEKRMAKAIDVWPRPKPEDYRSPKKVIKNVNVAHRLLPITGTTYRCSAHYDEAYLIEVEQTRSWILRVLADRADGIRGDIYYQGS